MTAFVKNKTFILFLAISFFTSIDSFAEGTRNGMFAGLSIGYQTISGTNKYSGLSYGLLLGRDFSMGQKIGMKTYFSLHTAALSPGAQITSPALGLGLNFLSLSGVVVASYDTSASGTVLDHNVGLKGELLYSLIKSNIVQFQIGGDFGAMVFLLKSSTTYGLITRLVWSLGK